MIDLLIATDPRYARLRARALRQRSRIIRRVFRRLIRAPRRLLSAILVHRRRVALVDKLRQMDDRTLIDIGLRRGTIAAAVLQKTPEVGPSAPIRTIRDPAANVPNRELIPTPPRGRSPAERQRNFRRAA